ncbi:thioesterase II family protein [Amycolatopsis azurea]|uniref:thioesterase II family protein n=1 Tax=Amycolatopsis azurea TaxID=36819 RepID=UPI0038072D98
MTGDIRLLCFPYAGGNAQAYARWRKLFPGSVEVCPVQSPGRGERVREKPLARQADLLDDLFSRIDRLPAKPTALFGHSLGALLAFECARRLGERREVRPVRLFVSGHRAPHLPMREDALCQLPDTDFLARLAARSSNLEAFGDPAFRALLLPALRADYTVSETYRFIPGKPLDCPVTVFGGRADPEVERAELEAWERHTTGPFETRMFDGDHFFVDSDWRSVATAVTTVLTVDLAHYVGENNGY